MSNTKTEDCASGLHDYCTPCECECHKEKLKIIILGIKPTWLVDSYSMDDDIISRTDVMKAFDLL